MYQSEIKWAVESFFPLRTMKRRNIDPPWISPGVKKMIRKRKRVFRETGGRTADWKDEKRRVANVIDERCKKFQISQKKELLFDNGGRSFFKQTKNYLSKERPKPFDIMDMYPGRNEQDVADLLATHFNTICSEFNPLDYNKDIPTTHSKPIKLLDVHEWPFD